MDMIRPAVTNDAGAQQAVEKAAGLRFAEVGMPEVAYEPPMSTARLAAYARAGCSWVACDKDGKVIGYVVVDLIDASAHIEQVSVLPSHQGRGLGRALIEEVERWAAARHLEALTLTTFSAVAWNRPLYEHLGFKVVPDADLRPGLRAVRDGETSRGLNPDIRICMVKVLA